MENKTRKQEKSMEQQMAESTAINCWAALNELHIEAKKWESEFYIPAVEKLYGLLAQTLAEVIILRKGGPKVCKAFTEYMKRKGITCTSRTSLELRAVRMVFGISDTAQRSYRYAKAISVAWQQNVTPEGFADWIVEQGGIDEVRRNAAEKKSSPNHVEKAETFYESNTAKPEMLLVNAEFGDLDDTAFRLLVVRKNDDGSYTPVDEVNSLSHVNSALQYLGKYVEEKKESEVRQKDDDERLRESIQNIGQNNTMDRVVQKEVVNG